MDPSSLEKIKPPVATTDWDYSVAERGRREHLNIIPQSCLRNVSQAGFSQQQILIASGGRRWTGKQQGESGREEFSMCEGAGCAHLGLYPTGPLRLLQLSYLRVRSWGIDPPTHTHHGKGAALRGVDTSLHWQNQTQGAEPHLQ